MGASDYRHLVRRGEAFLEVDVSDLDVVVTGLAQLRFTLDYPFDGPYEGVVIDEGGGITLRRIIDAIRGGFRVMYEGASYEELPNLANQQVDGTYGRAYHVLDDVFLERVTLDETAGVLHLGFGS